MSGESTRTHEETHNRPIPAEGAHGERQRAGENRVGPYGGDDGALEHERSELKAPDTRTPEPTEGKSMPGDKSGR